MKTTRRALFSSVIALVLCFAMLLGTTYAWFTDSVTSGRNIIQSGTLDVVLEYWNGSDYAEVDKNTKLFEENALWEPGYTEVVYLKVSNAGSLALKYAFSVNVYNEIVGKTKDGQDIKLSDYIEFKLLESETDLAGTLATREQAINATATANKLANYTTTVKALEQTNEADYIALVVYMPETVGNEANHNGLNIPSIELGVSLIATQFTAESDSFGNTYDENAIIVTNQAEAQAALDNAKAGATIMLAPGVNYGTLYLRPVDGQGNTVSNLNEADGEGYTIYRNEYIRTVENLTIIGATGAKVTAIVANAGHVEGSTCNLVKINNLVIDSVEFTDTHTNAPHKYAAPIFFELSYTDVNGLTVKDCTLIGNNDKMNFVYLYSSGKVAFDNVAKNITITGNTVDGIARLCELRQTENVTVTNNIIKNTALHGIYLPVHGGTYSGNVTITGNAAFEINERFVRMAGAGDANVVIKDNTITNYLGADDDYIKVTDSNGTPVIENNVMTRAYRVSTSDELNAALEAGKKNFLLSSGNYNVSADNGANFVGAGKDTVIDLDGAIGDISISNATVTGATSIDVDAGKTATFENVVFDAKVGGASSGQYGSISGDISFVGCTFEKFLHFDSTHGANILIENCTFGVLGSLKVGAGANSVVVKNCTFENTTATSIWGEKGMTIYCPATFIECEFNNRVVLAGSNGLALTFTSCTMNGGTPVYYVNNTDGIIRGGNVPNVIINN